MLHEARMNFQRTIVNQAPRFPCRGAAQFNRTIHATAGQTLYGKRDVPHTFKNTGDKAGRMMVVVAPAGLEKFFAEIGTPLASPQAAPVEPTPADIQRLLAAAPRYGLEILAPANP